MLIIIIGIGLGLILYGVFTFLARVKLLPISEIITGTVIDVHKRRIRKRGIIYFLIIEYNDPVANSVERFEYEAGSIRPKYSKGDSLELIYYSGENRKTILLNTWSGKWLAPVALIAGGVIFTVIGFLFLLA